METLEEETADGRSEKKAKISFPDEIIQDILSRLTVKYILRSSLVCKPWLSLISDPSFTNLHLNRSIAGRRTALFISAYHKSTRKRYFFSAAHDGASLTHLLTLDNATQSIDSQHLNGLVCFTPASGFPASSNSAFVVNPSTRNIFKLPDSDYLINCTSGLVHTYFLFGFDETKREHKILSISRHSEAPTDVEIFSLSSFSWRKVNEELPVEFGTGLDYSSISRVCVDSVIHFMLRNSHDIFNFDLRTEKFSKITTPKSITPLKIMTPYHRNGRNMRKCNHPRLIKINGCVGVVCHDRVTRTNEMHIWILQDYESRFWVKETITFLESWAEILDCPFPIDSVNTDEIVFSLSLPENLIKVRIYNMKTRCFKSVQFTLGKGFRRFKTLDFNQVKCYVESTVSLEEKKQGLDDGN